MSCEPMFSKWTRCSRRNCNALSTFSKQWIRIFPFVGRGNRSPERISRSLISIFPSRRSTYKSPIRQEHRTKWELTHFWKVFFCTNSRSPEIEPTYSKRKIIKKNFILSLFFSNRRLYRFILLLFIFDISIFFSLQSLRVIYFEIYIYIFLTKRIFYDECKLKFHEFIKQKIFVSIINNFVIRCLGV